LLLGCREETLNFVMDTRWSRPVCATLTEKQRTKDGEWLDDIRSVRNVRHFMNRLNNSLFGNAYKRYGKSVSALFVQEVSGSGRHHLHAVFDAPETRDVSVFTRCVEASWLKTRFGYREIRLDTPPVGKTVGGYLHYIMKDKTKLSGLCDAVDWENSTVFDAR